MLLLNFIQVSYIAPIQEYERKMTNFEKKFDGFAEHKKIIRKA